MFEQLGKRIYKLGRALDDPHLFLLKRKGVDISYYKFLMQPWFTSLGIDTVIDVGANEGQFSYMIHEVLPEAAIYSFEPLTDCYYTLIKKMAGCQRFMAFNVAAGDADKDISFYRSSMAVCSSPLAMATLHKRNFPKSANEQHLLVPMRTLDSMMAEIELGKHPFIKIDVQGFEDRVLAGGRETIQSALIVIIECSFCELYYGQASFDFIHDTMRSLGFRYAGSINPNIASTDSRLLQEDCIFLGNAFYP